MKARLAAAAGLAGAALAAAVPATAEPGVRIEATGWWWRARPTGAVVVPAPPGTDGGRLHVEGAPDGPVAVAAVRLALASGQAAPVLTLRVTPETAATAEGAVLLACRAGTPWKPAEAGAWDERPDADCRAGSVGVRAADGTTFRFDLSGLAIGGVADVVLVPGRAGGPAGADGSVFAVTFEGPRPGDVAVTETPQAPPAVTDTGAATDATGVEPGIPGPSETPGPAVLDLPTAAAPLDLPRLSPPGAPSAAGSSVRDVSRPAEVAAPAASVLSPRPSGAARAWAVGVLLATLAVSWWASTRPVPPPRPLVALGTRAITRQAAGTEPGGLGRFRRPRTRPPQRLV